MKKTLLSYIGILLLPVLLLSAVDHLIFTEIVMQPLGAEYVKIKNPTTSSVNLSDYYMTDATDNGSGKYYYNLPGGTNYWSGNPDDFIIRFPDVNLAAGDEIIIAGLSMTEFENTHKFTPDYAIIDGGLLNAVDGVNTIGNFTFINRFSPTSESLILFKWDGNPSSLVQDVDYLVWGNTDYAIDKTGVSTYLADTPIINQSILTGHLDGEKYIRKSDDEGTETSSAGNGITGHDETSENLLSTWTTAALVFPKPKISNLSYSPIKPTTKDDITFSCTVTDSLGLASVILTTIIGGDTLETAMTEGDNDIFSTSLSFQNSSATKLVYYVTATNIDGFSTISAIKSFTMLIEVSIATIQANLSTYVGETVNVSGLIISRADNIGGGSNVLLDDGSGTITIRIWNSDNILIGGDGTVIDEDLDELLQFGNTIKLSATVGEYNGDAQLVPSSASDFSEWAAGTAGEGKLILSVAPYPFAPSLGEVINYSVQYPDNARVILRVYDLSGRFITTLMDEHHGMSWQFEDSWNGRDELNHLIPPGKYLMVLESTNLETGSFQQKLAPVVIGVKF